MKLELNIQPGPPLTLNGEPATVEDIVAAAVTGKELLIGYGEHTVALTIGEADATVLINDSHSDSLGSEAHLDLSSMACCIGDACVMWPKKAAGG